MTDPGWFFDFDRNPDWSFRYVNGDLSIRSECCGVIPTRDEAKKMIAALQNYINKEES